LLGDVGRKISELRRERAMTQAQLAKVLGLVERHLQQIEAGDLNLTVRSLDRIAHAFDVTVADLFEPPQSREKRVGRPPSEMRVEQKKPARKRR
jgi:transcriptional regulator with XRE-family HTH domain